MAERIERFLCIANSEKGHDFLRQCAEMGVKPSLLTLDKLRDGAWPREAIEELATMPSGLTIEQILNTVSWMARGKRYDRIVALDESALHTAAQIREHMRIPGMGVTTAAYYRDRLAMRLSARESGFPVPEFCRVLNYDELREYMDRVPPPWLLKPRLAEAEQETRMIEEPEHLWRALDDLGDRQSRFVLEQILPGEIFCVDAIVSECQVLFSVVHQCGRPPLRAMREGEVHTTRTVDRTSRVWMELTALNAGLAPSLGMVRGVTHAQFIRVQAGGRFHFQEIAARVDGACIADLVELSSGVNLWREWARLEVCSLRGESYVAPGSFDLYAGSVVCQAPGAEVDASGFDAPEIVARIEKPLEEYSAEFARRLLAPATPLESLTPA
jgi:biotin carboxylase